MKKLLPLLIGFVVASSAQAQDTTDWKFDGSMRGRYELNKNRALTTGGVTDTQWQMRNTLGATMTRGDWLSGHIRLLHNDTWGQNGTGVGTSNVMGSATNNHVWVHEAWGWWKSSDSLSFTLGRQAFVFGDQTVFATNDWIQLPFRFDGLNIMWDSEWAKVGIFGARGMDYNAGITTTKDTGLQMYWLTVDVKNLPEILNMLNIHFGIINADPGATPTLGTGSVVSTTDGYGLMRYGVALGGEVSNFNYRVSYNGEGGESNAAGAAAVKFKGSMIEAEAGYRFVEFLNAHLNFLYHIDSGQDASSDYTAYNPLYYDIHESAGLGDFLFWGNLTYFDITLDLEPMEGTNFGLKFLSFTRSETTDGVNAIGFTAPAAGANTSDAIGSEIDIYAKHNYGNDFNISLVYSMFSAGDHVKNGGSPDGATRLYLQTEMKF